MILSKITVPIDGQKLEHILFIGISDACEKYTNGMAGRYCDLSTTDLTDDEIKYIKQNCDLEMSEILDNLNRLAINDLRKSKLQECSRIMKMEYSVDGKTSMNLSTLSSEYKDSGKYHIFTMESYVTPFPIQVFFDKEYYDLECISLIGRNGQPHRFESIVEFQEFLNSLEYVTIHAFSYGS